ncbi:MAG: hypothetical protein A2284_03075 [Deltaproteobacteria bacterium RIFOXYA12_FULL_61_11]|nr:MAG: hypothetical protein A2284_03075 [Deltaproteobacteria bacterium RIFOXYA12_FULL_61_11]
MNVALDYTRCLEVPHGGLFLTEADLRRLVPTLADCLRRLREGEGDLCDQAVLMTGWQDEPGRQLPKVEDYRRRLAPLREVDHVFIVGIGGSYLGPRALYEALGGNTGPELLFLGYDVDPQYARTCLERARGKVGCVVISKSGTTVEPAMAFRYVRALIHERMGSSARKYIKAITGAKGSVLRRIAEAEGYDVFDIPEDIGGRFSVMTPVGVVPGLVASLPMEEYLEGALAMKRSADLLEPLCNPAAMLAALRYLFWERGAVAEYQVCSCQRLESHLQWAVQLQAESEGHYGHGVHVLGALFPRDLHSVGQLLQEGPRNLYEVATVVRNQGTAMPLARTGGDDGLDGFVERVGDLGRFSDMVVTGALNAHFAGGAPSSTLELDTLDAAHLGALHYLLFKSTALMGLLLRHNPFVQPGVKAWKDALHAVAEGQHGPGETGGERHVLRCAG